MSAPPHAPAHLLHRVQSRARLLRLISAGVLVVGTALSVWAWREAAVRQDEAHEAELATATRALAAGLAGHVLHQVDLLTGVQSLFRASEEVTRREFHEHVASLDLPQRYPGLLVVQFARQVRHAERAAFEQAVRRDTSLSPQGYPQFHIHPTGERPSYVAVLYQEPMAGNEAAFGHDNADGATRIEALERARDSGRPVASGPITLLQGTGEDRMGFVVRAPVYRNGPLPQTVAERRAAYIGQVSAVVRIRSLMEAVLSQGNYAGLDVSLTDLGVANTRPATAGGASAQSLFSLRAEGEAAGSTQPRSIRAEELDVAGRRWAVTLSRPLPPAALQPLPLALLCGGLLGSLGLAGALWAWARGWRQAAELGERLSRDARESQTRLQSVIDHTVDGMLTLDETGRVLTANAATCRIFVRQETDLVGQPLHHLLPELAQLAVSDEATRAAGWLAHWRLGSPREMQGIDGQRRPFPLDLSMAEMALGHSRQFVAIVRDQRERRASMAAIEAMRRQLNEVDEMRRVIVQHAPYAIVVVNKRGLVLSMNPAAESLLGWRAEEVVGRQNSLIFHDPEDLRLRAEQLSAREGREIRGVEVLARHAAADGGMSPSEWTLVRKDGRKLIAEINVNPLRNEEHEVTCYLAMAHDVTDRRRAEDRLQHLALHDALTGLPNRAMLQEQLKQALAMAQRSEHACGLMFLDLDRFKKINDTLGHHVGDKVLIEVAQRLRDALRQSDIVARLGGDEFVVLLPRLNAREDIEAVSAKLLAQFRDPMHIGPHEMRVTPSIGVAIYPDHGTDVSTLMRHADQAMYRAKTSGRNAVQVFSADLDHATLETLELENDLYRALERGELELHYQPQFDCASGRLAGAEALMRWKRGGTKMISPAQFIPIAEDTGLIIEMGDWALRHACAVARRWRDQGHLLRIGVNLSALQLEQPDMVERVSQALAAAGLPPQALELEITESVLVRESIRAAETLSALRHLGVSVAIDDFGVGYSSFAYLRELPIDRLKIDRSFLSALPHSPGDARLTAALIAMAQRLEVGVVAEGVENEEQFTFLKQHGCDEAQGYHLGRPMAEAAFESLLQAQPRSTVAARV